MSPDRHADRLHAQLAGGAELTADQQRHVATCAACQRAVAEVGKLDSQLRAAAAGLASESIPDADLEPVYVPRSRWAAPLSVVVAAGLIGIVIGYALGQVRPPTGADATPSPSAVAQQSERPDPSAAVSTVPVPSPTPSPSPSPMQDPNVRTIPLAAGGDTCADGQAGFSMIVPEGWYANLRTGDAMACAFLAPEPFDPLMADAGDVDPPIRLTTSVESTPPGTVVDEPAGGSTAEPWTVERDGEEWLVSVVELFASIGDEPAFLHLQTRAADGDATEALDAILEGLTVGDPLFADEDAIADAEAQFADADVCSDLERGVNVIMPDVWWTNTILGDLLPCTYYAPESFAVPDDGGIPDGVPITLELVSGEAEPLEEVIGSETLVVDYRAATREEALPPDTDVYRYVVALDDGSLVLTLPSEQSDDYERDKAILDEMMRRLVISPTPASVLEPGPLPSCGWELVELTSEGQRFDVDARECLWEAYEAGDTAEMISTGQTVEGAIVRHIYRTVGTDEIEWIVDASRDNLGSGTWQLMRCTALELGDDDEVSGAILFMPTDCDDPIILEP